MGFTKDLMELFTFSTDVLNNSAIAETITDMFEISLHKLKNGPVETSLQSSRLSYESPSISQTSTASSTSSTVPILLNISSDSEDSC
jgi:hypothetical protein